MLFEWSHYINAVAPKTACHPEWGQLSFQINWAAVLGLVLRMVSNMSLKCYVGVLKFLSLEYQFSESRNFVVIESVYKNIVNSILSRNSVADIVFSEFNL